MRARRVVVGLIAGLIIGSAIGAHPGYPDRANFGRIEIAMKPAEIAATVHQQIARLDGIVRSLGGAIVHVKPHGALYNVAVHNAEVARAIADGVVRWNPNVILFGLAGSPMLRVWRDLGLNVWREAFADRRYEPDGSLMSRKLPGSLLTVDEAAAQARLLAREGAVIARDGSRVAIPFDTICIHADMEHAVERLRAIRSGFIDK